MQDIKPKTKGRFNLLISNFDVLPGQPYIIAEVGSNWQSLDDCILSIAAARTAGANAVKFQLFTHEALYGVPPVKGYDRRYELPPEWLPKLRAAADASGVDFMCTIFDHKMSDYVNQFVPVHKVASSDINYMELLTALSRYGKTVILSTGAAYKNEIRAALKALQPVPVIPCYCVANYPARNVDLTIIDKLRVFGLPVGYSDHTTDYTYIPYAAAHFHGAAVIEKHFTAIDAKTPDSGHSLGPKEFKAMTDKIRGYSISDVGPSPEEEVMLLKGKRRLIATAQVKKGDPLKAGENYGAFRPLSPTTQGISPLCLGKVDKNPALTHLEPGHVLGFSDF